jgi:hypothetical protein
MCMTEVKKCGAAVCSASCAPAPTALADVTAVERQAVVANPAIKPMFKLERARADNK